MNQYIYEKNFKELLLDKTFPLEDWVINKVVPNSNILNRPDFRCEKLKLIIEFNGDRIDTYPGHYSSSQKIITDYNKTKRYENMGYKVINYPYFIQPSISVISNLFNIQTSFVQLYPHGFIDDKAKLPCDFCILGEERFLIEMNSLKFIENDIKDSLLNKIKEKGDWRLVVTEKIKNYFNL